MVVTRLVVAYEVVNEARKVGSGLGAAAAGTLLLGPIGLAGGLMGARKKRMADITWEGGLKGMLQVDTPAIHTELLSVAFNNGNCQ